jgi:hypothetical protein
LHADRSGDAKKVRAVRPVGSRKLAIKLNKSKRRASTQRASHLAYRARDLLDFDASITDASVREGTYYEIIFVFATTTRNGSLA